jgi:hypothetical protein
MEDLMEKEEFHLKRTVMSGDSLEKIEKLRNF